MTLVAKFRRVQDRLKCEKIRRRLDARALLGSESLTSPLGPAVSLTTHGHRLQKVHLAIESIGEGKLKPSRILLWLGLGSKGNLLSRTLQAQQQRGLEIRFVEDCGPHTKYYPYILHEDLDCSPMVTADDDILYPQDWLSGLHEAYTLNKTVVNCHRARRLRFNGSGELLPYETWELVQGTHASYRNLATGVSGVIYPPDLMKRLRSAGDAFKLLCSRADDLWLHSQGVIAGYPTLQIQKEARHFMTLEGSQTTSLQASNVYEGQNDAQVKATYSPLVLRKIYNSEEVGS